MGIIKNIAFDSLTYGGVTVLARLLNYAMIFFHVRWLDAGDYGTMSTFYSLIAIFNIIYLLGLETTFFRFINDIENDKHKIGTIQSLIVFWSLCLSILLFINADGIALQMGDSNYSTFIRYSTIILFFDALSSIPFVQLRFERRTRKYVSLKVYAILINIALQCILVYGIDIKHTLGINNVHAIFLANLGTSLLTALLLVKKIHFYLHWDKKFIASLLMYSFPLTLSGLGGMMNETLDRTMLPFLASPDISVGQIQNGIYAANYKLSILITLFIQAYRLGAEPFLFKLFKDNPDPLKTQATYAKLMHIFVVAACVVCLLIVLFLHLWKYWIVNKQHPAYEEGLFVVPILVLANLMLGMYFNLSIWFKITNKTMYGLLITLLASTFTIGLNYALIPLFGYWACAWITLSVYMLMVILAYVTGQKNYPIPYKVGSMLFYLSITTGLMLYYVFFVLENISSPIMQTAISILSLALFICIILVKERMSISTLFKTLSSHLVRSR